MDKPETRGYVMHLMDHEMIFPGGPVPSLDEAYELIRHIPTRNLLVWLSMINMRLFLNDSGDKGLSMQFALMKDFLLTKTDLTLKILEANERITKANECPALFYRVSNLTMFNVVLKAPNDLPFKEPAHEDVQEFLKAYLIINSHVNSRIRIDPDQYDKAMDKQELERVLVPAFIYQKDYVSNSDYGNQMIRGCYLFDYIKKHPVYGQHLAEYLASMSISEPMELLHYFMMIITQMLTSIKDQLVMLILPAEAPVEQALFLNHHSHNLETSVTCKPEFAHFREKMFVNTDPGKYIPVDINLVIDQLYKAQVFAFNKFLKTKELTNFLSDKAYEFMEQIYMPLILQKCFPAGMISKPAADRGDFHLVEGNKLALLELKDVMMQGQAKNSSDPEKLFAEIDRKFVANESGKAKGLGQLAAAAQKLATEDPGKVIYPVLAYTDNTYGYDGINKLYSPQLAAMIPEDLQDRIKPLTLININFFEHTMDYLKEGHVSFFDLLDGFHEHITQPAFTRTPFEVYAMGHIKQVLKIKPENTSLFLETHKRVRNAALGLDE